MIYDCKLGRWEGVKTFMSDYEAVAERGNDGLFDDAVSNRLWSVGYSKWK
jgi:hypothetical protein